MKWFCWEKWHIKEHSSFEGLVIISTKRVDVEKIIITPTVESELQRNASIYITTNYKVDVKLKLLDSILTASDLWGCLTQRWERRSEYKIWSFVCFTSSQAPNVQRHTGCTKCDHAILKPSGCFKCNSESLECRTMQTDTCLQTLQPLCTLLSSCLASDVQHRAARNNITASFSLCSQCRFWECDSTLLGYQVLRASAVLSSPVVPQTARQEQLTSSCSSSTFLMIWDDLSC